MRLVQKREQGVAGVVVGLGSPYLPGLPEPLGRVGEGGEDVVVGHGVPEPSLELGEGEGRQFFDHLNGALLDGVEANSDFPVFLLGVRLLGLQEVLLREAVLCGVVFSLPVVGDFEFDGKGAVLAGPPGVMEDGSQYFCCHACVSNNLHTICTHFYRKSTKNDNY